MIDLRPFIAALSLFKIYFIGEIKRGKFFFLTKVKKKKQLLKLSYHHIMIFIKIQTFTFSNC